MRYSRRTNRPWWGKETGTKPECKFLKLLPPEALLSKCAFSSPCLPVQLLLPHHMAPTLAEGDNGEVVNPAPQPAGYDNLQPDERDSNNISIH
jgi:hypothetical protein